jgi:hypothetical protein
MVIFWIGLVLLAAGCGGDGPSSAVDQVIPDIPA